jgi:tetratricopeptide (TPR) repeat protein
MCAARATRISRVAGVAVAMGLVAAAGRDARASSADELVREAQEHERANEDDVAARRYTEALAIDSGNQSAWLGLGALRFRIGEIAEAERVYAAALAHVPGLRRALEGRARSLWALGRHAEAEASLREYADAADDTAAYRLLAGWFGTDGRLPAQLATWRRILARADEHGDPAETADARVMVRALVAVVGAADPAASPAAVDPTRIELARIAREPGFGAELVRTERSNDGATHPANPTRPRSP